MTVAAAIMTFVAIATSCEPPKRVQSFCYIPNKINDTTHDITPPLPCASTGVGHILRGQRCLDQLLAGPSKDKTPYGEDRCCYQATLLDECDP